MAKRVMGREGANITVFGADKGVLWRTEGPYGEQASIYQAGVIDRAVQGKYPVLGLWIVGDKAAGMGIREGELITDNMSNFVPHVIKD